MKRWTFAICTAGLVPWAPGAQTAPPVYKDPHHRMVLSTDQFRILDVNVPPGETGRQHYHDRDVATVGIAGALTRTKRTGEGWSDARDRAAGSMNVAEFAGMPESHMIQNVDRI